MVDVQRYDVVFRVDDDGEGYRKLKDVNGPYVLYDAHRKLVAALKLAATEQATQAEAVLEERTRERDALALSQGRLLGALENCADYIEQGTEGYEPTCYTKARAAIAEATPEGEKP